MNTWRAGAPIRSADTRRGGCLQALQRSSFVIQIPSRRPIHPMHLGLTIPSQSFQSEALTPSDGLTMLRTSTSIRSARSMPPKRQQMPFGRVADPGGSRGPGRLGSPRGGVPGTIGRQHGHLRNFKDVLVGLLGFEPETS